MEQIFKTWYKHLKPILDSKYFINLVKHLDSQYELSKFMFNKIKIYPTDKKKVFKCFNCDFNNLKVVFIGSKPFDEFSEGLAFDSTNDKISLHSTSELIRYKIEEEFYDGFHLGHDATLEYLVPQGVLLLNESLTTTNQKDHKELWSQFIQFVLKIIQDNNTGIIFCIDRQSDLVKLIDTKKHHLLTFEDPSKCDYDFNSWDFKFKDINNILEHMNGSEYKIKF